MLYRNALDKRQRLRHRRVFRRLPYLGAIVDILFQCGDALKVSESFPFIFLLWLFGKNTASFREHFTYMPVKGRAP